MAITLAQAQVNVMDGVVSGVIDEFRRSSFLLENMPFDDAVSPLGGGATLTYGYTRVTTPASAGTRSLNEEYTKQHAKKQRITTDLAVFGGAFDIDRVIARLGGIVNELDFQVQQKVKAARSTFHDLAINGDNAGDAEQFDGLDAILAGASTERGTGTYLDLTAVDSQAEAFAVCEALDALLSALDSKEGAVFLGNEKLILKLKAVARWAGYLTQSEDAFGRTVDGYGGVPFVDLGDVSTFDGNGDVTGSRYVVEIATRDVDGAGAGGNITGLTDLYVVRPAMDGFHGVTVAGGGEGFVEAYLPDLKAPGAVKTGEVEMVAGVALKATKAAAVLRNIKVQ